MWALLICCVIGEVASTSYGLYMALALVERCRRKQVIDPAEEQEGCIRSNLYP